MRAQYQRSRRGFSSETAVGLVEGSLAPNLIDLHEALAHPFDPVGLAHAHQADARAEARYLLAVGRDLRRAGEPGLGQAAGEPGADILGHGLHHYAQVPRSAGRVTMLPLGTCPPGAPSRWRPSPPPETWFRSFATT